MLQRLLARGRAGRLSVAGLLGLALPQCGGQVGDGSIDVSRGAIVGGRAVDAVNSPVLYLRGPEGACSAVLVAPTLVVTARHCVAYATAGAFACTAAGELILTGSGAGQIGDDVPPSSLGFFAGVQSDAGSFAAGPPDAVGVRILSTQTLSACRDDLAFVVLDRAIAGPIPLAVRYDGPTKLGETMSVSGYGLTDQQYDRLALRTRDGVPVVGVGPDLASNNTQLAPVRSIRVAPVTCQGDSGGAIVSMATGALVGIVSLGSQAATGSPSCNDSVLSDTIGPRLAAFHDLVVSAFAAAGALPIAEATSSDAATGWDSPAVTAPSPAPSVAPDHVSPNGSTAYRATGAACTITLSDGSDGDGAGPARAMTLAFALTALAVGRRRR